MPLLAACVVGAIASPAALAGGRRALPNSANAPDAEALAEAASDPLNVNPFPGTPDASPQSQIIFSALARSDLASVDVQGSRSGLHLGRLITLPDQAGVAFVPNRPFTPGERVQVSASLTSAQAGTASGSPGATHLGWWFTVALPVRLSRAVDAGLPQARTSNAPRATAAGNGSRVQSFHSQPNFHPPVVNFSSDPDGGSGDIFLSPNNSPQVGAMIVDGRGHLVWFRRAEHSADFNLAVQHYQGNPVLTWWHGNVVNGHGINGQGLIMGQSYRTMHIVTAGHGYTSDLHEFQITPQGTALIDAYVPVRMDLSKYGGPKNGTVIDCVIQELDIKTNHVLWEWHSLGHIPLSASYAHPTSVQPWDYLHLNSIDLQPNQNLLLSARNTWAAYLIGQRKGSVIWTLGGKDSTFKMGSGTNFEWQHDARMIGQTLSVFDDAGLPQEEPQSSAKEILVNRTALTATLQHVFTHSPQLLAGSQGNAQTLSNGNLFVGWGSEPDFSEYSSSGKQIFNGSFPLGVTSYRAYRYHWSGQPKVPPAMANSPGGTGAVTVWSSWNGATTVGGWRVLGGPKSNSLHVLDAHTGSQGFETRVVLHSEPRYFAVQALGSKGKVIATSAPHLDKRHLAIFNPDTFVHTSNGYAGIPVGCFTGSDCSISLRVRLKGAIVGQSKPVHVVGGTGAVLYVQLSSAARSALAHSSSHRILVEVTARGTSGISATTYLTAIPYSTSGSGPTRNVSQSPSVQVANTTSFVSSSGAGAILAACYAAVPCGLKATLSVGNTVIATTSAEHLGVAELGNINFKLNSAGQSKLAAASGNQLAARIKLTDGSATASGQIALVRHG
jgi:Arylsulfotransferase (ASST)